MTLDVRLLVPGLPFDPEAPLAKDLGGSETAGIQLALALARQGHTVTCFANVAAPGVFGRVAFVPQASFLPVCQGVPADLLVVQRVPEQFAFRYASKVNVLWVHDLHEARRNGVLMGSMHGIDRVATVSAYQIRQHREACPDLPESAFLQLRNGIDLEMVQAARDAGPKERDLRRVVCAARPERGLDVLLREVWPRLQAAIPDLTLEIAGYACPAPHFEGFYQGLRQLAAQLPGVTWLPPLPKPELYRRYWTAGLYLYPTPSPLAPRFREVSCISAMEAMACGLPFLSTDCGALRETVGEAGVLVPGKDGPGWSAAEPATVEALVNAAFRLLSDRDRWRRASEAGKARAAGLGWDAVAARLVEEACAVMAAESADPYRLAKHFVRRQDIDAAREVIRRHAGAGDARLDELAQGLNRLYAHAQDTATLAAFYDREVGPTNGHVFEGLMQAPMERFTTSAFPRYACLRDQIAQRLPEAREGRPFKLLDWGCSQGECSVVLANAFPEAAVVGVDASRDEIARARRLAQAKVPHRPERLTFLDGDEAALEGQPLDPALEGPFDVLVLGEVLEHLIDPAAFLERIERRVRPGGLVLITVPYGPWELQKWKAPTRQHLREYEGADLKDLFGRKPGLTVDRQPSSLCPVSGEALGCSVVAYEADHAPPGRLDWDRKLARQRPRQTLSACMMVGGPAATQTLDWCLESLHPAVDEIVIADAGMEERAREIARRHGATILAAPSPLDPEVGFEGPRNLALDRCRMDWILMIDADEKLMSALTVWRYLRESVFHTFAVRQHHFAVDASWKPDVPGRLFRRRPEPGSGKPMRFWGKLHEHAEIGVNEGTGCTIALGDLHLAHLGYLDNQTRSGRFDRNLPLLEADARAYPNRKLMRLVVMRDSVIRARQLLQMIGADPFAHGAARAHPHAAAMCEDVVRIFREAFKDEASMMADEAALHYHDACLLLGCDYTGTAEIQVQRSVPPGPGVKCWASIDDLQAVAAAKLKGARDILDNPWW